MVLHLTDLIAAAIWLKNKDQVDDQTHTEFYRSLSNAMDEPMSRIHYHTDVPLAMHVLLYVPTTHPERYGMGRMEAGVSLYSRKVLISPNSKQLLPEWLRFLRGVVDSEDIPLNISRESMQDSALLERMRRAIVKRAIRHFDEMSKSKPELFDKFYAEYQMFIKEGVVQDFQNKDDAAKLLRYEVSTRPGVDGGAPPKISLDEYISKMPADQKHIFYLTAPSRQYAEQSPYLEAFVSKGYQVLFCYTPIDEFVMKGLDRFNQRRIISLESEEAAKAVASDQTPEQTANSAELVAYLRAMLSDRASSVEASKRKLTAPMVLIDHEAAAIRQFRRMASADLAKEMDRIAKYKIEVNASHPMWQKLMPLRDEKPELAKIVVEQAMDNAMIAAELLDSPRSMLGRLQSLIDAALESPK